MNGMKGLTDIRSVARLDSKTLLKELTEELLPKMPSVAGGWRLLFDTFGQEVLAQVSARLILLTQKQQDTINQLEQEITMLKAQLGFRD